MSSVDFGPMLNNHAKTDILSNKNNRLKKSIPCDQHKTQLGIGFHHGIASR
ncbi:hypothetical protein NTGZN8_140086 [Candidatus Nitrotoga fabula]|uniref:Uncharacterized protein n=1 Tax=Candidatus Nitrotoga fabula TaxID=2182327 RepID=A0A916BC43_9PROT|nr:hypothetical protein NTGZN8_140086 [Candidatus Nitrotoga fabula]